MQLVNHEIFKTIANQDFIGLTQEDGAKKVVDFLDFTKNDISKATGQPKSSIRYDKRIPKELKKRLIEIGKVINLVIEQFDGDTKKAELWFNTGNPILGNMSPIDMIRFGRYEKLQKFISNVRSGNLP